MTGEGGSLGGGGGKGLTTMRGKVREFPAAIVVFFLRRFACWRRACLMTFLLWTMLEYPEHPGPVSPPPSPLTTSMSASIVFQQDATVTLIAMKNTFHFSMSIIAHFILVNHFVVFAKHENEFHENLSITIRNLAIHGDTITLSFYDFRHCIIIIIYARELQSHTARLGFQWEHLLLSLIRDFSDKGVNFTFKNTFIFVKN